MDKNLKEALSQMLFMSDEQVLDIDKINFKKEGWYQKYHWTEKRENEYKKWFSNYLKKNWKGIVNYKMSSKSLRDAAADQFILAYGCKTRELRGSDFTAVVSWAQLDEVMSKREREAFNKWMFSQTTSIHGVYRWDLEAYLNGKPNLD